MSDTAARATFTAMTEGTQEDWSRIALSQLEFYPGLRESLTYLLLQESGEFTDSRLAFLS